MDQLEKINLPHALGLGISPNEADLAIVSIDNVGTLGLLNKLVLKEYGYTEEHLPDQKQLKHGFGTATDNARKPIIFVVTVDERHTADNIELNLYNTLVEFRGWMRGKKTWLPLMGTGSGGLTFEESYTAIVKTVNKFIKDFPTKTTFLVSIPDSLEGKALLGQINSAKVEGSESFDSIIRNYSGKFYLVGSIWGGEDQMPRFIKNGIWEKGFDDESYEELINKVKSGDIIVIKSTFASGGISYLRIKAFGVVSNNSGNGSLISVDWKIIDITYDIENKGHYRNAIHEINNNDIAVIFSRLNKDKLIELVSPSTLYKKKEAIAGLISDSDLGVDYLNIAKDVDAFARVISAKSFEPPLAIALFGKWGSGKSFFMKKLKERIINFSLNNRGGIYCEGVAQIHFNAWSYMDSNLWASIVTKIFEELNEYISENKKDEIEKKEIEKQLVDKLSIAKDEIGLLENKKIAVASQIASLELKRQGAVNELNNKINELRLATLWRVITKVDKEFDAKNKILLALQDNTTFIKTEDDIKKIVPEKYWNNPSEAYQVAKSKYTVLKGFFKLDRLWANLAWLTVGLSIVLFVPLLITLLSYKASRMNFAVPQAVMSLLITFLAVFKRLESVYTKLQPFVTAFWSVKESYEKQVKEAVSKFEQDEKVLNLEIAKGKAEIILIEEQIQKSENIKLDLEYRINNAFATEALYSFIDRRSKSEDYKKHLGIISIIRRDFEILNSLFTGHNQEFGKIEDAESFRNKFKKPLERIVLYIDDLDRCPEENVVQVLEAVNLLMAFPLFVVVVGVDSRWVKNALIKKHALQFTGKLHKHSPASAVLEVIEPASYLEKIFQIPFHLKSANDISVKEMIMNLAQGNGSVNKPIELIDEGDNNNSGKRISDNENFDAEPSHSLGRTTLTANKLPDNIVDNPEALVLTDVEVALMQDMSEIIGSNPRAIKRYVNTYRIIKAHEEFDYEADYNNQELVAILFLLALPLGDFRQLLTSFEDFIQNDANNIKPFTLYLQSSYVIPEFNDLKNKLYVLLSNRRSFGVLENTTISLLCKHRSFIERFTYSSL